MCDWSKFIIYFVYKNINAQQKKIEIIVIITHTRLILLIKLNV